MGNHDPTTSNLPDRELLLKLLSCCLSLPRAATATEALCKRYQCYADAITAPIDELLGIASLGERGAALLKCVHSATTRLAQASLRNTPILRDRAKLYSYLNAAMARNPKETYRVLFLDERDHLISDEILAEGVENWVNVSIRETARRGLLLGATAIIIVHNHPSGNSSPSESDLLMTRKLQAALKILGICVHDHVIIGNGQVCSLLQLNFFEP